MNIYFLYYFEYVSILVTKICNKKLKFPFKIYMLTLIEFFSPRSNKYDQL